jgi:hypothetical protein
VIVMAVAIEGGCGFELWLCDEDGAVYMVMVNCRLRFCGRGL